MYSPDLRWRVVWLKLGGMSSQNVGASLLISHSTVDSIFGYYKKNGTVQYHKSDKGAYRVLSSHHLKVLQLLLLQFPSMFLDEYLDYFILTTGTVISLATLWRAIDRLGFSYQKLAKDSILASDNERADFVHAISGLTVDQFVWADEVGTNGSLSCLRTHGYGVMGARTRVKAYFVKGTKYSTFACMSMNGVEATYTYQDGITAERMEEIANYLVSDVLQPFPSPKSVLLLDNVNIHKNPTFVNIIEQSGARIQYLPRYSPEFNPIENLFAKLKALYKRSRISEDEYPVSATIYALSRMITIKDCLGYIHHAGYF